MLLKILSLLKKKATAQLKEAKAQAASIVDAAKKHEAKIVEEAAGKAQAEKERIIASGHTEIETERNRAKEELRRTSCTSCCCRCRENSRAFNRCCCTQ